MKKQIKAGVLIGLIMGVFLVVLGTAGCTSRPTPDQTLDTLNSVMDYIKQNHPDVASFIKEDMSWTKSDQVFKVGYTQDVYSGDGWTVTIGHAATAEVVYEVKAEYAPEGIVWSGTIKDDIITEESYTRK